MSARSAMLRDYPHLMNNVALLDKCLADVPWARLVPIDKLYLAAMLFERLGGFFQGVDVYFTNSHDLKDELERFEPTFCLFSTRDLLRGVSRILQGRYPELEFAPNPHQLAKAVRAFQKNVPAHRNNLSLCPPISDEQLAYYLPNPEDRARYRANTIEKDSLPTEA